MSKQSRVSTFTTTENVPALLEQFRETGCPEVLRRILEAMGNPPEVFESIKPFLFSRKKAVKAIRSVKDGTQLAGTSADASDTPGPYPDWVR